MYYIYLIAGLKYKFLKYRNLSIKNGILRLEVQYRKKGRYTRLALMVVSIMDTNVLGVF